MLARILSLGFVLKLAFVSCSITGAIKKSHPANGRWKFRDVDEVSNTVEGESNDIVKRTLVDIHNGINLRRDKHGSLRHVKTQRSGIRPEPFSKIRQLHKIDRGAVKRQSILNSKKNDTANKSCKFPFIFDEKTRYTCLDNLSEEKGKKWCSLTSNYDRDLRWMDCPPVSTPFKRSENTNFKRIDKKSKEINKAKSKLKETYDEICTTCDKLPKNATNAAVQSMHDEIDDVDKSDKRIHAIVTNEVDNFIGSILQKHGVPDTEQQELIALNAKLSTELTKEVSCKVGDANVGSSRSECNSTTGADKSTKQNFKANQTLLNQTVHTKDVSSAISRNEVDNFIGSVLSQYGVSTSKQKDILASRSKTSTDIADQISYVLANAKTGTKNNKSVNAGSHAGPKTVFNMDKESESNIHAKVDSFLGSLLAEHGVSSHEQKDMLAWNANLSTDISDQVGSIVEKAGIGNKKSKTREEQKMISKQLQSQLKSPEQLKAQLKALMQNKISEAKNKSRSAEVSSKEAGASHDEHNDVAQKSHTSKSDTPAEHEIKPLPDTLQPIYRETWDSENDTAVPQHKAADAVTENKGNITNPLAETLTATNTLQVIPSEDPDDAHVIHESDDAKEPKSFDDISSDNDMETGTDDISFQTENDKLSSDAEEEDRGIAPDAIDAIPEAEETISPFKIQYNGDNDENNITAFANKEFNKKPQIHSKKSRNHKRITGNENWDKYLTDDGWMSKSNKEQEKREDTNSKDFSGEREQLNDEEKTMINYVSDSIIESVKNVKHPQKEIAAAKAEGSGNDLVTYKKLDSGKKPYLIYRVKQSKNEYSKPPGVDAVDSKTQKIIPGAKNINIIIINNRNNTLDLNDIENTIARSSENLVNSNSSESVTETTVLETPADNTSTTETPVAESNTTESNTTLLSKAEAIIKTIENNTMGNTITNNTDTAILVNNYDSSNDIDNEIAKINLNALNISTLKNHSEMLGDNYNDADIERKFNESKQYLNATTTRLLVDYDHNVDKNSESPALQSLRKSGLVSMNYAPEEIEIKTFGGNANGKKCMFPFIYNGDTYFNCINLNRDKPWCSINANYDKTPKWGYCNDEQLAIEEGQGTGKRNEAQTQRQKQLAEMVHNQGEEVVSKHSGMKTFGGNANGARCVMPFVYDGQTHESCIPRHDGTAWCAASHSYDIHPVWGNCCHNEMNKC